MATNQAIEGIEPDLLTSTYEHKGALAAVEAINKVPDGTDGTEIVAPTEAKLPETVELVDAEIAKLSENTELPPEEKQSKLDALEAHKLKLVTPAEEKKDEPTTTLPEGLKEIAPDATTVEQVVAKHKELQAELTEQTKANESFVKLLEDNPVIVDLMKEVAKSNTVLESPVIQMVLEGVINKTPSYEIARQLKELFDNEEIPEAGTPEYDTFVRKQVAIEASNKQKAAEAKTLAANKAKSTEVVANQLKAVQIKFKLTDQGRDAFAREMSSLLHGDPKTGVLNDDFVEKLYYAYNRDTELKKAREEAKIAGRNEVISEYQDNGGQFKKGSLPDVRSAATAIRPTGDRILDEFHKVTAQSNDSMFIP